MYIIFNFNITLFLSAVYLLVWRCQEIQKKHLAVLFDQLVKGSRLLKSSRESSECGSHDLMKREPVSLATVNDDVISELVTDDVIEEDTKQC